MYDYDEFFDPSQIRQINHDFIPVKKSHLLSEPIEVLLNSLPQSSTFQEESEITKESRLWIKKYTPQRFQDLLTPDKTNRELAAWLKSWEPIVFQNQKRKAIEFNSQTNFDISQKENKWALQNQVVLLAGPPGTGKTTIARVLSEHYGYDPMVVNASEERTAKQLLIRADAVTNSEKIQLGPTKKPGLLILDEVDGTLEGENKGAITQLLKFMYSNPNKKASKEDNQKGILQIKKPIIFICNDIYGKGMKELRNKCLVFHFKSGYNSKLIQRLEVYFLFSIFVKKKICKSIKKLQVNLPNNATMTLDLV